MKATYYFPHDYEPTSDPKIQALLGEYGAEGYGVYWRIVEMLHSDDGHELPMKQYLYLAVAKQMLTTVERVQEIITFCIDVCELFVSSNEHIFSERVNRNVNKRQAMIKQRVEAGKKSAEARKRKVEETNETTTTVERPLNEIQREGNKTQQTKLNKIKLNKIKLKEKNTPYARDEKSSRAEVAEKITYNFKTGHFENLPDCNLEYWTEQFPAIDINRELKKIEAWLYANPKNRKSNYKRFITGWLNRSQDKAKVVKLSGTKPYLHPYQEPGREPSI